MNLTNQVCSLKLAKRLKELGVKQESVWWWIRLTHPSAGKTEWSLISKEERDKSFRTGNREWFEEYSAFTVAELGEMLPVELRKDNVHLSLLIQKIHIGNKDFPDYGRWGVSYLNVATMSHVLHSEIETLANAATKMLIYLLENGLCPIK